MRKFIHSIWFSTILLFALWIILLCWGCQYNRELQAKIIIDVNDVQIIEIPAGTKIGNITIKKKGTFFSDEARDEILKQIFEKGLMQGFIQGQKGIKINKV